VIIRETKEYEALARMFEENGLEIQLDEFPPEGLIRCWEAISEEDGKRMGAIVLEKRDGEYIVGDVAVDPSFRHRDIGTRMMEVLLEEARLKEAKRLMLVAKVPDFFKTFGFVIIPREGAPKISKCLDCPQFKVSCFPEIMELTL
jgi:N-acetylglutamate synthase-like GNAT family acetyltransferase